MAQGPGERLSADAVVIGTGAGGGPAAALLAEAGLEVIALEAGQRYSAADFVADEAVARTQLGRVAASADGLQSFYAGACVGGSTVVNDALCWRTPPEVLARWRSDHALGPVADELAPFVERAWRDVHAEPTDRAHLNRNAHALERGAGRLGWAAEAMPRNVSGCANLGRCNFGCPTNAKQSSLVAWLPRAERAGARVLPGVRVERIRTEAGRARADHDHGQRPARRGGGPPEAQGVSRHSDDLALRAAGDLSALDRRSFLRLLGAAAAAGVLPAACTRAPAGPSAPPALRYLSPRGWAVLNAAAARIAGPDGPKLVSAGVVDPALGADRFLAGAPALVEPLGQALLVVEIGRAHV